MKNRENKNVQEKSESTKLMAALLVGIMVFAAIAGTALILVSVFGA